MCNGYKDNIPLTQGPSRAHSGGQKPVPQKSRAKHATSERNQRRRRKRANALTK